MKIYIGSDHNGFTYKEELKPLLEKMGHEVIDKGDNVSNPDDDFPEFAGKTVTALLADSDPTAKAILICGSGQGMCMAANRFKGIRASLCWNEEEARAARNDDDSNVLCLSSRYVTLNNTEQIINVWLNTTFAGAPRFARRNAALDQLTN